MPDARALYSGANGASGFCAVRAVNGSAVCWGYVFIPDNPAAALPLFDAQRNVIENIASIAIGGGHYCAALENGTVGCAGRNDVGELGTGNADGSVHTFGILPKITGVVQVAAGESHTCARTKVGALYCWGLSSEGQLGLGPAAGQTLSSGARAALSPTLVSTLDGVVEVAAGGNSTCVRLASGQVKCFGDNKDGNLGDDTLIQRPSPIDVVGLP
jgi:alpha-tubulin suppressor-like RCC1 family protein